MTRKTQEELEQPVKVYQLDAVETKVDTVLNQLDTILKRTDGLATLAHLEEVRKVLLKEIEDTVSQAVKDIHAEYRPTLKKNKALWTLVGALILAIVGQAIIIVNLRS